jgi:Protein of unknown function (DUF1353)
MLKPQLFTESPALTVLPRPDYWAVVTPLVWDSPGLHLTVPAGFITDLASIPKILRDTFDVDGHSRDPAILHDWLYCTQHTTRAFADSMLREALVQYGESAATAWVYWAGVRLGGWHPWSERLRRGGGLQLADFDTVVDYHAAMLVDGNQQRPTSTSVNS